MKICKKEDEVKKETITNFKSGNIYSGIASGGTLYIAVGYDKLVSLHNGCLDTFFNHSNFIDVTDKYCLKEI
jgi:hypothetical protein